MTATIVSKLIGGTQLVKTDAGTLSIASDANLGNAAGAVTINTGTIETTADLATNRAITLDGTGTLLTGAGTGFTVNGVIDGAGSLTKDGAGTLLLTGANSYAGGTTIAAGTLQLGNGGTSGSIVGNVANSGVLAFNRADNLVFGGVISGSGNIVQNGAGTTELTGISTYTGNTTASAGELRLADGGQITSTLHVFAGSNLGESGTITVDGAGSMLNITGDYLSRYIVGGNGMGTLNITDGGLVAGGMAACSRRAPMASAR